MATDTSELEFLVSLRDEATQALHSLEGVLKDVTSPLPDITAGIDIDAAGAAAGAAAAGAAAAGVAEDFDTAGKQAAADFDSSLSAGLRGVDPAADVARGLDGLPPVGDRAGTETGEGFLDGFRSRAKDAADEAGASFKKGLPLLVTAAASLGVAASVAFASSLAANMDAEAANAKLTGQLHLSAEESARFGALAGQLYASNYGESVDDVNGSIASVVSSIKGLRSASDAELGAATTAAMNFGSTFDTDVAAAATSAGILIQTGLAGNAQQAFDLITAGAQAVGPAMVEPLLEASNEYATNFAALGYSGDAAFAALADASSKGEIALDKAGDAVKEFTILGTDMSANSVSAYKTIGLNAEEMSNKLLAGGDTAQAATQEIVAGLLAIKDPTEQANTAIKLFGSPLEDIGVNKVPAFLASMQAAGGGLGDVTGRAQELDATLGGTTAASLETVKRQFQQAFSEELGAKALPVLSQAISLAQQYSGPLLAVAAVLGTLALLTAGVSAATAAYGAIMTVVRIATTVWTGVQWALNAAMAANPIGAVILLIVAIVAAVVLAYNKVGWFKAGVDAALRGVVAAWGWLKDVAAQVPGWFTYLVGKFKEIGGNILDGLMGGLRAGWDKVKNLAKQIGDSVSGAVKGALGIHSPSRVMIEVGEYVNEGLVKGLTGSAKEVETASTKIGDSVYKAMKDIVGTQVDAQTAAIEQNVAGLKKQVEALSATAKAREANAKKIAGLNAQIDQLNARRKELNDSVESVVNARSQELLTSIGAQTSMLAGIAAQRDEVAVQIKDATKRLEDAVKLRDDFAAGIASQAEQLGALTGIKGAKSEDGKDLGVTFDDIVASITGATTAVGTYQKGLEQLRNMGLNDDLFTQLAKAGAEKGQAYVTAILAGGPGAVQKLNDLQSDLGAASARLGDYTSRQLYQAGVESAMGLLLGLSSKEAELYAKAEAIANTIAAKIRAALDIHSPSRVMKDIGQNIAEGIAVGIAAGAADAVDAAEDLADDVRAAASGDVRSPAVGRPVGLPPSEESSRSASASTPVTVTMPSGYAGPSSITVVDADGALIGTMAVVSDQRLAAARQDELVTGRQKGRGR